MRQNTSKQVKIGFGSTSDWLRKWGEIFQPIAVDVYKCKGKAIIILACEYSRLSCRSSPLGTFRFSCETSLGARSEESWLHSQATTLQQPISLDCTSTPSSERSTIVTCAFKLSDCPLPIHTSTFAAPFSRKCRTAMHSTVCPLHTAISRLRHMSSGSHKREYALRKNEKQNGDDSCTYPKSN